MSQTLGAPSNTGISWKWINSDAAAHAPESMGELFPVGRRTVTGAFSPASEIWLTESLTKESHSPENCFIEIGFINRPAALWRPGVELGPAHARDAGERCGREAQIRNADKRRVERTWPLRMQRAVA